MTKRFLTIFLIFAALALLGTRAGWTQSFEQKGLIGYIVFMHTGPKATDDAAVRGIAVQLVKAGYVVRAPDGDQDRIGGPGVDYFADEAKPAAQALADSVNKLLQQTNPQAKSLQPRKQNVKNPANYLGLWLF